MKAQLYAIDARDFGAVTDAGFGPPSRRPRLTAQQRAIVRYQLERGPCLAAFDARIHGITSTDTRSALLVQTDDLDAVPGLRP